MRISSLAGILAFWALNPVPLRAQEALPPPMRLEVQPADYRLEFFPRAFAPGQRPLVLALGGGAAKGIAHAGVLQRLQEEGIPVSGIAGTSMGAFVGSMYATGYSGFTLQAVLEKVDLGALLLDRQHRFPGETLWEQENERVTFLSLEFEPGSGLAFSPGTSPGLELKRALQIVLSRGSLGSDDSFDHLRVPFRAVCSDIQSGRPSAPDHGELATVVRASMSIPGLFSPVILDDHQHVDGMLVQNLPVETARTLIPSSLVMAVEVGKGIGSERQTSVLSLAFRSLDVSIEERTEISRRAADILVRPDTRRLEYLDFHHQVSQAIEEGRRAFDLNLEALEIRLYGPEGALPAPTGPLTLSVPEDLRSRAGALVQATLPRGALLRRHYWRLLRRIHAAGFASRAEVRFLPSGPVLEVSPQPVLETVDVQAPGPWRELVLQNLEEEGLRRGAAWNPVALARALDRFYLAAILRGHPILVMEGTAFDPAAGNLQVKVREVAPERITIREGILSPSQTAYLQRLFAPYEGTPTDVVAFAQDLHLAERRLGLKELRLTKGNEPGRPTLVATPVPDDRTVVDAAFAYESTLQTQGSLAVQANRLFGTDFRLGFHASTNRIRSAVDVALSRPLGNSPRVGWQVYGTGTERRVLPENLHFPFVPTTLPAFMSGRTIRERSLGLGLFARVGMEDRGLLSLDYSRRWIDYQPAPDAPVPPALDQAQVMFEWDSFDRYLFPTEGLLLRVKAAQGRRGDLDPDAQGRTFRSAYVRVRNLWPLGPWASLEGDLESGLGWRLPLSRWYDTGGPDFFAGTPSGVLLTPNFATLRVGLPLRVVTVFGVNLQVVPRVDAGYLGASEPGNLTSGPLVRGIGASVRSEIGRWYCEVAVGRWFSQDASRSEKTRINVLLGAHPFDLWRER